MLRQIFFVLVVVCCLTTSSAKTKTVKDSVVDGATQIKDTVADGVKVAADAAKNAGQSLRQDKEKNVVSSLFQVITYPMLLKSAKSTLLPVHKKPKKLSMNT